MSDAGNNSEVARLLRQIDLEFEAAQRGFIVAHIVKTPKSAQIRATLLLFNHTVFFKMDGVHALWKYLLTSNLMDYALPHSGDVPDITSVLVEIPSTLGPFGAKGVGEPPVVPVGAAIANAVFDAVGAHVTQLPITPERLFEAMK